MSEQRPIVPGQIVLRASVEIDGRKVEATTIASPHLWGDFPQYQDAMKAETLRLLGEAIIDALAPEVTVTAPTPQGNSIAEALWARDYPSEY